MSTPPALTELLSTLPQVGRLEAIWLRPARRSEPRSVSAVEVKVGEGLVGDRYRGRSPSGKRQVTVIQAEHVPVIGALSGNPGLSAATLRRNLVVAGIPVGALKGRRFRIGSEVVLEWTEVCDPCSRMEQALGAGGYNAMRGMGGVCARVLAPGEIRVGDTVVALPIDADDLAAFDG